MCIRNRCNSQNINIWKICYRRSMKSTTSHFPITVTSFHRAIYPNLNFVFDDVACDSKMLWENISRWADTRTLIVFISANHTREYLNILYETTRIC